MRKIAALLGLLLILTGCTASHELTSCRGTFQAANPDKWLPQPSDLSGAQQ